ncbi:hypothetical protein HDU85_007370 [Gaertneriomyces sp. JEL0708]|nr:hypothetical protein HDU85_007370 [Gaertneriomyces sp. JEL0708]
MDKCKYWDKCYQKNPLHLARYEHPAGHVSNGGLRKTSTTPVSSAFLQRQPSPALDSSSDESDAVVVDGDTAPEDLIRNTDSKDDKEQDPLACISGIKPLRTFADGETLQVTSKTSSATYTIKRTGDHYYCTCPAWRNQGAVPLNARTCKHLKEVLGDQYEIARHAVNGGATALKQSRKRAAADDDDNGSSTGTKKAKREAPKLLLANSWDLDKDPTGWWVSEKLDGVRALWDPKSKTFLSRLGNPFTAPDWFIEGLPANMSLDGELFAGRGKFSETVSVVKTINSKQWHKIKFHVFDAPSIGSQPFEQRIEEIKKYFASTTGILDETVHIVEQQRCAGPQDLLDQLKSIEAKGGEGLMLREFGSAYEGKRSATLRKVKTFYDAEAKVVGYEPGKGKHKGSTGALKCVMESGKEFKIGTGLSDQERRNPPAIDAIVTYRFQELTNDGVPRFPSYIGVRVDADEPKDYVFPKKTK